MKDYNKSGLKAIGILMVIFGLLYALVGTLALAGVLSGVLPGHETQQVLVVVLSYGVALLALLCGVVCIAGNAGAAKVFGILFAVLGFASLVYQQLANDSFSTFDSIAMCFGVAIVYIASKIKD